MNIKEIWRDIPDYVGYYQVSNYGRIKSLNRYVLCGNRDYFVKGRVLKLTKNTIGYLVVNLYKSRKRKQYGVHRLALSTFDRQSREGEECNHKDGNKANNYLFNLEWVTRLDNVQHSIKYLDSNKKKAKGEKHYNSKFTEKNIKEIKNLLKEGNLTQQQIANMFNVKQPNISKIKLGKAWKNT